MTSSARTRIDGGTVRPSALAVLRFTTSSNFGRLLDGQIGRLGALKNPTDIDPNLAKHSGEARSVADQATGRGEFAPLIDRRNGMACRQRHDLLAPAEEKRIGTDNERAGLQLDEGGEQHRSRARRRPSEN
jgi:hypothetical protein